MMSQAEQTTIAVATIPATEHVPAELLPYPNWVAWRIAPPETPSDKPRKLPVNPHTGQLASSTDPRTWGTFAQAVDRAKGDRLPGVGFVLTNSPFAGVDFDHCRDPQSGTMSEPALTYIRELDSYTEASPSGTGVHVLVNGKKSGLRCRRGGIEIYDRGRYFTCTGLHLEGTPRTVNERTDQLAALYHRVFDDPQPPLTPRAPARTPTIDDSELLARMFASRHGSEIQRLMAGDTSRYNGDDSAADLALCCHLAFWTAKDSGRMDRVFRTSGLMRDKWDSRRGDGTYGRTTIDKAIQSTTDVYSPDAPGASPNAENLQKDLGHATALSRHFSNRFRWAYHRGTWMEWIGSVWRPVPEERVAKVASDLLRAEYMAQLATATPQDIPRLTTALRETCLYSRIQGALSFLKGWDGILTHPEEWDAEPWALTVANGFLDLRSRELRPHDPRHLTTKLAPVKYDATALADGAWARHIERFLPNANVRRQVQRDLGRALVGSTLDESLSIWYGLGANGKTTTARAVQATLGDFAQKAAPNLLVQSKHDRHPTEVADLCGARVVFSIEIDEGKRLAESVVKDLTGGDIVKARFMRENFFEFQQTFSITLIANHRPVVAGADEGIWRRIRLVPWEYRIPDAERRPQEDVIEELVADGSAVLNWFLDGLADWTEDRHWIAEEVRAVTAAYRAEQDAIGDFVDASCELSPRFTIGVSELYDHYTAHCAQVGEDAVGKAKFSDLLSQRGVCRARGGGGIRKLVGIRLQVGEHRDSTHLVTPGDEASVLGPRECVLAVDRELSSPRVTLRLEEDEQVPF